VQHVQSDERDPHAERVDVHEAVRLTGLHQQTVYRLGRQGRIRSYRVLGRSVRFDRSDLLDLVKPRPTQQKPGRTARVVNDAPIDQPATTPRV
jgi:excisionase family DNA binding protein